MEAGQGGPDAIVGLRDLLDKSKKQKEAAAEQEKEALLNGLAQLAAAQCQTRTVGKQRRSGIMLGGKDTSNKMHRSFDGSDDQLTSRRSTRTDAFLSELG